MWWPQQPRTSMFSFLPCKMIWDRPPGMLIQQLVHWRTGSHEVLGCVQAHCTAAVNNLLTWGQWYSHLIVYCPHTYTYMHNTRTLKLKQLNGVQPSLSLWFAHILQEGVLSLLCIALWVNTLKHHLNSEFYINLSVWTHNILSLLRSMTCGTGTHSDSHQHKHHSERHSWSSDLTVCMLYHASTTWRQYSLWKPYAWQHCVIDTTMCYICHKTVCLSSVNMFHEPR